MLLLIEPEPGLLLETTDQYLEVAERRERPFDRLEFRRRPRVLRQRRPAPKHRQARPAHPALPRRGYRREPRAPPPRSRHGRHRFRRSRGGDPRHGIRRMADGRALPVPRRSRSRGERRPRGPASRSWNPAPRRSSRSRRCPRRSLAYLQLIRLPNVVTAAADSLAGWLLVTGLARAARRDGFRSWPRRWCCTRRERCSTTCSTSRSIASNGPAGRCLRAEPPGAPPPGSAGWGWRSARAWRLRAARASSGLLAAVLALAILGYDAGLKHTWLGPVVMGACRGLNLLLGMTHAAALGGPIAWLAALAYGDLRRRDHHRQPFRGRGRRASLARRRTALPDRRPSSPWRPSASPARDFRVPAVDRPDHSSRGAASFWPWSHSP